MTGNAGRRMRGLTLGEILVSMTLLLIISTLCLGIFTSAWRRVHITNAIRDIQESAVIAMDTVTCDLRETTFSAVINNTPGAVHLFMPTETAFSPLPRGCSKTVTYTYISFPLSRNTEGTPLHVNYQPDWQSWVLYYLYPDPADPRLNYLARKHLAGPISSPPNPLSHVTTISGARIVARNLTGFSVANSPDLLTTLEISITTGQWVRGKECTFSLQRPVRINNL